MSDKNATRMLATYPQQVVHAVQIEFVKRQMDKWVALHTAADHCLTNQVRALQAEWGSRPTYPTSSQGCRACR